MWDTLTHFFRQTLLPAGEQREDPQHAAKLAAAALLMETARADFSVSAEERQAAARALQQEFSLSAEETAALMTRAEGEGKRAPDYFQFTSLLNRTFTPAQKIRLIEHLWQVAYADRRLDKYEDHLVRKIADLLYVSHRDFIGAKLKARQAAGVTAP